MGSLIVVSLLFASLVDVSAGPAGKSFQFVSKNGGHEARVVFTTRPFDGSAHRITKQKGCPRIDGRAPLGTDCSMPRFEIASIDFSFDGKSVPVLKSLYQDCYEPPFKNKSGGADIPGYFAVRIGDDLKSVFIFMYGGDAAGSYQVLWVLRPDGKHSRFSGACADCGFIDFQSGFFNAN
jgi:hypothetical protein